MKITFLGTGAADWSFEKHKDMDGYRRYSSILIDDCLLVDPGPDVPNALSTFGKCPESIRYILNTHSHIDHYSAETVAFLKDAVFYPMQAEESLRIGKYTVLALRANHSTAEDAKHFIISDGEKNLFYGLDGAWLLYQEVAAIKAHGIDLAILDGTMGDVHGDRRIFEHNNLNMVLEIKSALEPFIKRFFITHMARTLHVTHGELAENMKKHGVEVAFDGCEIDI